MAEDWVTVARLVKARGIKGEVAADPATSHPDRFRTLGEAAVFDPSTDTLLRRVEIENAWEHGDRVILKFSGVDTMSDAEQLAGTELRVPLSERPPAGEGEYYQADLIGCRVYERDGTLLGEVASVENYGGQDLLAVAGEKEILIPFVRAICVEIDPAAKRIVAELPEGLKEL